MSARPTGRNVLLVVVDSARADLFQTHAPAFLEMARTGMLFECAIAPAGWTLPSHVSMFSGLAPTEHRAIALGHGTEFSGRHARRVGQLAAANSLLAPRLSSAGVRTLAASPNPWVGPLSGLDSGFERTDYFDFVRHTRRTSSPRSRVSRNRFTRMMRSARRHISWMRSGNDKGATRILETLDGFLREAKSPFFAFVNLLETHWPHVPFGAHTSYQRRLAQSLMTIPDAGFMNKRRRRMHNWDARRLPPRVLQRWKDNYIAEIRYVDQWLARTQEILERRRLADETVVIVTGDHGESFGEDGFIGHGMSLDEGVARVPLAIWGGDIARGEVPDPVGLARIASTIEGLMLPAPKGGSLLNAESWGRASMEIEDPARIDPPPSASRRSSGWGAAFYDGALKLVISPFSGETLYDIRDWIATRSTRQPTPQQVDDRAAWQSRVDLIVDAMQAERPNE